MGIGASRLIRKAKKLQDDSLLTNVASVAIAVESLERLLIEKGVLSDDELMKKIGEVAQEKARAMADQLTEPS